MYSLRIAPEFKCCVTPRIKNLKYNHTENHAITKILIDETEVTKTTVKRPITANSGKTFEEWLKEKKEDKPRDIKSTAKMSEEDIKKA